MTANMKEPNYSSFADYTSRVKAFGCGMIYQMDPSGVFVNLHNFEGGVPNFTNLPSPPTVDGASPTTPLVQTDGGYRGRPRMRRGSTSEILRSAGKAATLRMPGNSKCTRSQRA
jgi:hypothetical protein